ncbi:MAG: zinc ribbon domain-containing protein [Aliivibrio sp.]|uniref:zinc-ribbon domain-containing protein n=1 Tax=Aliivibrio sp. TaxID=1872443 RepID=UPI001A367336|nr:zinc ribbon domain-containing protein [Aliivibrio sp.]
MALVACKECNKEISDTALTCPHCGISTPGISNHDIEIEIKRNSFLAKRWVAGLPFWLGVLWLVLPMFNGAGREEISAAWQLSKWLIGFGTVHYVLSEIERNLFERKVSNTTRKTP